jgi:hypothetical protein
MKLCKACNSQQYKPLSDFYPDQRTKDGHASICIPCWHDRVQAKYEAAEPGSKRAYKIRWHEQNRERTQLHESTRRAKNRAQIRARMILSHAIRDGSIQLLPCFVCGDPKSQAHHHDYSKPLEVTFLCRLHHDEAHKNEIPDFPEEQIA